jgi:hypothetical protein
MKKVVLVRFGDVPSPTVSAALKPHLNGIAIAFPVPGAVMSIFETESSEDQIAQDVKATGAMFLLFPLVPSQMALPVPVMEAVNAKFEISPEPTDSIADVTLEAVIARMREHGIISLTEAEKQLLQAGL